MYDGSIFSNSSWPSQQLPSGLNSQFDPANHAQPYNLNFATCLNSQLENMQVLKVKLGVHTLPSQRLPFVLCRLSSRGFTGPLSPIQSQFCNRSRVAGVGWLSRTAAESLRALGERVFANFPIAGKQAICGCQRTYTHTLTGTFPQTPF